LSISISLELLPALAEFVSIFMSVTSGFFVTKSGSDPPFSSCQAGIVGVVESDDVGLTGKDRLKSF